MKDLKSVPDLALATPFTESQIRWWIFQASENGLDKHGAIIRIGRRVYIDVEAFDRWLDSQAVRK